MHLIHPCYYFYASVPVVNVVLRFQVVHLFVRPIFINMISQEHNEGISLNMHKCPFGHEWTDFDSQRPNLKNSYTNNDISHKGLNTTKWWSDELRLNQNASKTWMYVSCDSVWFVDVLKDTSAGLLSQSMKGLALRNFFLTAGSKELIFCLCTLAKQTDLLKTAWPCFLKASWLSLYLMKKKTEQTSRSAVSYFPWWPILNPGLCCHAHRHTGSYGSTFNGCHDLSLYS